MLTRKPGALPGATALAQARAAGPFTGTHERYWDAARRRLGDGAGTRALIEVLLLHRSTPAAAVLAGMDAALGVDRDWSGASTTASTSSAVRNVTIRLSNRFGGIANTGWMSRACSG